MPESEAEPRQGLAKPEYLMADGCRAVLLEDWHEAAGKSAEKSTSLPLEESPPQEEPESTKFSLQLTERATEQATEQATRRENLLSKLQEATEQDRAKQDEREQRAFSRRLSLWQWHGTRVQPGWVEPVCVVKSSKVARPGYDSRSASEYMDEPAAREGGGGCGHDSREQRGGGLLGRRIEYCGGHRRLRNEGWRLGGAAQKEYNFFKFFFE